VWLPLLTAKCCFARSPIPVLGQRQLGVLAPYRRLVYTPACERIFSITHGIPKFSEGSRSRMGWVAIQSGFLRGLAHNVSRPGRKKHGGEESAACAASTMALENTVPFHLRRVGPVRRPRFIGVRTAAGMVECMSFHHAGAD